MTDARRRRRGAGGAPITSALSLVAAPGRLRLWSTAVVEDGGEPDPVAPDARQHPVEELPAEVLPFLLASRALLAAQRQGRYEALYDALLRLRAEPTEGVLQAEAQRAGLDWARLRRDMDDPAIQARLQGNIELAQRLQLEGTPALIIGDTTVPGAVELPELERLVAEARRRG